MNAKFLPSSAKKNAAATQPGRGDTATSPAAPSERACCCASKAAVRVTIPPSPGRPRQTDLLLCGHHYRVSGRALAAAQAAVSELPGLPRDLVAWIDRARLAALAGA